MSPRPVLIYDRDALTKAQSSGQALSPDKNTDTADDRVRKGARIEDRIEQARELRARAAEPAPPPASPWQILSPSSLNEFVGTCQVRWFYRRVLQLPETRGAYLGLGSAVHDALAGNFRQKIETRRDLPAEGAVALFRAAWAGQLDQITLEKDDDPADLKEAGEVMTRVYMDRAAPKIEPAAVELRVSGEIGGVPVQGYVDVLDVNGDIIDMKTAKRATAEAPAGYRNQIATYAMLAPGASGKARLDTLTKGKTVDLKHTTLAVTDADRHHTTRLYQIAREQMAAGIYAPNRGATLCSRKYCSFWQRCVAEYGGEVKR